MTMKVVLLMYIYMCQKMPQNDITYICPLGNMVLYHSNETTKLILKVKVEILMFHLKTIIRTYLANISTRRSGHSQSENPFVRGF